MGEAKRRRDKLRDNLLKQGDLWTFPETEWERGLVLELSRLPVLRVTRAPDRWLRYTRMVPQQCHTNASFMARSDPEYEHVTGWWPLGGNFALHSVVRHRGQLVCVTPLPSAVLGMSDHVEFIPDPMIEWRREGAGHEAYRGGVRLGPGVRTDPVETMRQAALVRERLLTGMDPHRAVFLP